MISASEPKPVPAKRRISKTWRIALAVCALLALAGAVYSNTRPKAEVRIAHPTYEDIASTVSTTGTVVPVNDYPARANFTGLVEKVYVKLGQKVHAGQMLVRMKDQYADSRLQSARAALDEAELNRENVLKNGSQEDRISFEAELQRSLTEQQKAAAALDAAQQLQKRGSVSGAEVEAATQRLDAANTSLRVLQQRMKSRYSPKDVASWNDRVKADRAQLEAEKVSWANANISSPVSGTVYILPVRQFDFVPSGADLLHVADLNHMQVRAEFDEPDVGKLTLGQTVTITWDGAPGRVWHGRIASKPLAVSRSGSRNVGDCTIALDDDRGDLPVNTNVALVVKTQEHRHVLAIPREALHTDGPNHFVYRVEDGKLVRTSVEQGLANAMSVEIKQGLKPTDVIALHTNDNQGLADNLRVTATR